MASANIKTSNPDPHRVLGKLVYASRNDQIYAKEKPYNLRYVPAHDIARTNIQYEVARDVPISDLRSANVNFSHNCIRVVELQSKMDYDDFSDEKSVEKIYLREARDCIKNATGSQEVYIFEWQVRTNPLRHDKLHRLRHTRFADAIKIFHSFPNKLTVNNLIHNQS
jgi:hypothetical protein